MLYSSKSCSQTSASLAALANGTTAHALDYEDTNRVMIAHPSIQLLPVLFALGETFEILDTGMSYKLYPCCAGTHASIDSALEIVTSRPIDETE